MLFQLKLISNLPFHAETSSGRTIQNSCQSDLGGGTQQPGVRHDRLRQKVIGTLPQGLWVLQCRVPSLKQTLI